MKKTAIAPSNIAFIKYWGRRDEELRLPENGSISMNLSDLLTTTTVEFSKNFINDNIIIDGQEDEKESARVTKHLDRIRKLAHTNLFAKVVSQNNFPSGTGLSSSASGFAALTVAASAAAGLNLSEKELSVLARLGSGSACRSIPDGFTEWLDGNTNDSSYSISLYPPSYWDIADVVVVASNEKKKVSTTEGQKLSNTSPFYKTRQENLPKKIEQLKQFLKDQNFNEFGKIIESEALELHSIMLTSTPSLIYLLPNTIRIMHEVKNMRNNGIEVYFTLNTGQDVHLICRVKDVQLISDQIKKVEGVKNTIINTPSNGTTLSENHLF